MTVDEGDSGSVDAVFTVSLTRPSSETVTVVAQTADGTATAGVDYTAVGPVTLTFPAGTISQTFTVPVLGDLLDETERDVRRQPERTEPRQNRPGTGTGDDPR